MCSQREEFSYVAMLVDMQYMPVVMVVAMVSYGGCDGSMGHQMLHFVTRSTTRGVSID